MLFPTEANFIHIQTPLLDVLDEIVRWFMIIKAWEYFDF